MTTVGVVGGTGPAGRGLAVRLASGGYDVLLGSRDAARARDTVEGLVVRGSAVVRGVSNEEAATGDLVIVATPWDSAVVTVGALREALANKIVISMVNSLSREGKEVVPFYPPRGSMTAQIAHALPASTVVGAFHHLPARQMEDLESDLDADVIIFSDSNEACDEVANLVNALPGLRGVVAGSLSLASAVEAFTAVCISVNIRHKAHSYVRLAGLHR